MSNLTQDTDRAAAAKLDRVAALLAQVAVRVMAEQDAAEVTAEADQGPEPGPDEGSQLVAA